MVLIPGGEFMMGSEDGESAEKPRHRHKVEPFYMGIFCVTVAQFRQFVLEAGYTDNKESWWDKDPDDHPVRYVNYDDAQAYASWSGLRLPTEAEWEYAARGYESREYPWGNDWEEGSRVCWSKQQGPDGATVPVDGHPEGVSPFGLYQMSGNLWEWCEDWYEHKAYTRYAKGDFSLPGSGSGRVLRGGSWRYNDPRIFRSAYRSGCDFPEDRFDSLGFRLARAV